MTDRNLETIGTSAYESIAAMVAALQCDYDRLEELRDERDDLQADLDDATRTLKDCATAARQEAEADYENAGKAMRDWEEDSAEEFRALKEAAGDCEDADTARQRIEEDALSVQVRSGWTTPGEPMEAEEYNILLTTGGPAVRIIGELGRFNEPATARLQVQDWGTPWTEHCDVDRDVLLAYAQCFFFGE